MYNDDYDRENEKEEESLINISIIIQANTNKDEVPSVFGYKPFIVLSGSMEYEIHHGDLIFVKTINPETYKEIKKQIDDFFHGKYKEIADELTKQEEQLAANLNFEQAQQKHELIESLKTLKINQSVQLTNHQEQIDIVAYKVIENQLGIVIFGYVDGKLLNKFDALEQIYDDNDTDSVANYLLQYYEHFNLPSQLYISLDNHNLQLLENALHIPIKNPTQGAMQDIMLNALNNAKKNIKKYKLDDKKLYEIEIKPSVPKRTIVVATMVKKEPNYSVKKLIEMITKYNLDVFSTDEDGNGYFLLFGTPLVLAFGPDYDGIESFDDFDLFYEYFSYYSFLVNESDEVGFVGYDKKDDTIVASGVVGCNFGGLEDFMTPQGIRSNVKSCANNGVIALYEDGKQVWENDYYDYSMIVNPHIVGDYIVALGYSYDGSEVIVLDMEGTIIQKIQLDDEYYFLEGGDKSFMVSSLEVDSDSICAITEDQNVFGLEFEDPADVGERDDRCYKKVNQVWYIPLTIETKTDGNGTVTAVASSRYGEDVSFTVSPKEGFVLGEVKVTDEFGNVVIFNDYHFTMPNANVVIDVTFLPENSETADIAIVALVVIALGTGVVLLKNRKRLN